MTCTSCAKSFTLNGTVCLSSFNFQIVTVFGVNLNIFQANYLSYLNQLANAANTNIQNIIIFSITSNTIGSVTVNSIISTNNLTANSTEASTINSNLKSLFASKKIVMPISSYSITTNGGSIPSDNDSTSSHSILIVAIVVPVACLGTFFSI
jgi:hypothetical protein